VGFALEHALTQQWIARGDEFLLLGTAAGLSLHGMVVRF
jgi:3-oxoacyl-[acyl-carrier-protein] synthase III